MMKFFDTHAHLNISPLSDDAELIVNECIKNKLLVNNVGVNIKTSQIAIDQAKKYKNVYASVGIHPTEVNNFDLAQSMLELEEMLKNKKQNKIIAVGETGFDFHYDKTNFYLQKKFFEAHLKLALKYKLPLILHIRDAYEESFEILQKIPKDINVLIHCFDSTVDVVKKYSKLDFYIAFGGKITYPKTNQHLLDVLDVVNSERILCETDAPWLTPHFYKGKINKPVYVIDTIKFIADNLKIDFIKFSKNIFENSIKFFNNKNNR